MLTLEDPSSNICENEGTGPTPSGHSHCLNKVFKMHLVKGCGMKEWAPPYYFHIYCEECLGGYVHQFWSINSKKCNICDPLIKNCQIGVCYFMWGTVTALWIGVQFEPNIFCVFLGLICNTDDATALIVYVDLHKPRSIMGSINWMRIKILLVF